ncbi:MAG: protein kinase [Gemmatimonadota bacterium]|nr:protein kinase [Gemmatimonadota bacterium]
MTDIRESLQQTLGPTYTVERELGGGGMSRVFVAYDQALNRRVAVKVVSAELAASVHLERFMREILVAATLQNPHIVGVLSAGEVDGLPYFTMPFIEGESLRARIAKGGPMPVREAVTILRDVARALAYAHERGIVHRDIKPDNVLLASGSAMVTDFGVAKAVLSAQRTPTGERAHVLTQVGTTVGTPAYMAPEQIAADPDVDARADVYSFGIMAYEMLAGGTPFASVTPHAILAAHLARAPRPLGEVRPDLPPRLVALVMRCLEKDRGERPQSAREIVDALDDPAVVSNGAVPTVALPASRRRRRLAGAAAALLVVAAGATAVMLGLRDHQADTAAVVARDSAQSHSVLVIPFVNRSADSTDTYFADGITSELVSALTRIPGLRVASWPAGATGGDQFPSWQEVGRKYHVDYVLMGTVLRDSGRVQIAATLVNATDGFTAWANMLTPRIRDVFSAQQEIAAAIVSAVEPQIAPPAQLLADRGTKDDTAYEAYTRATGFISRRGARGLRRAIAILGGAVRRDSSFAKAYAATARAYSLLPLDDATAGDSAVTRGIAAATRAIALDSTLADAYTARAALYQTSFRWSDAEQDFRHAIAINPRDAEARESYGEFLLVQGRIPDALRELRRAATLDPTSATAMASYATALAVGGQGAAALDTARRAMALDSTGFVTRLALGSVYAFAGHPDSALTPLEAANSLATQHNPASSAVSAMLAYAYARAGDTQRAQAIAQAAAAARSPDADLILAHAALGAGDTTRALAALQRAAQRRDPQFTAEPLAAPIFDQVRASDAFAGVLRTVGLPVSIAQPRTVAAR